jgi:hypothetical protein
MIAVRTIQCPVKFWGKGACRRWQESLPMKPLRTGGLLFQHECFAFSNQWAFYGVSVNVFHCACKKRHHNAARHWSHLDVDTVVSNMVSFPLTTLQKVHLHCSN